MNGPERVRRDLAMQEAGYHARLNNRDVAALLDAYDRSMKALRGLVDVNESWNASVLKIIERPVGWADGYLDEARAVLAEADAPSTDREAVMRDLTKMEST